MCREDIWKENILKDLEAGALEYIIVGEFLVDLKREFDGGDNETIKVSELKNVEQGNRIMEEFVQEFRRVTRGSRYKEKLLVEEFKRRINSVIRRKLMETEMSSRSIEQWYE